MRQRGDVIPKVSVARFLTPEKAPGTEVSASSKGCRISLPVPYLEDRTTTRS
jgi:hypothetical protein